MFHSKAETLMRYTLEEVLLWDDVTLDEHFDSYFDEVARYGIEWWRADREPQRQRLATSPELRLALHEESRTDFRPVQTKRVYRDHDEWSPARTVWQRATLNRFAEPAPSGATEQLAFVLLGIPGSGKTSSLRRIVTSYCRQRGVSSPQSIADADELRVLFPEYEYGLGSEIVQDELQRLAYDDPLDRLGPCGPCLQERVFRATGLRIIDTIGNPRWTPRVVDSLAAAGAEVHVLVTEIDLEEALRRVKRRALTTGRVVAPAVVASKSGLPRKALDACLATGNVAAWAVLDTSMIDVSPQVSASDVNETYGLPGSACRWW
jgi:hypothetical protein